MGMTPLEGLVMGTRSGDTDPGRCCTCTASSALRRRDRRPAQQAVRPEGTVQGERFRAVTEMIAAGDEHAKQAYDVYIHRLRRYFGAYLIDLRTTDIISFTAG